MAVRMRPISQKEQLGRAGLVRARHLPPVVMPFPWFGKVVPGFREVVLGSGRLFTLKGAGKDSSLQNRCVLLKATDVHWIRSRSSGLIDNLD